MIARGAAAADVRLLIEVPDATLNYDRSIKVPLYARHGVTEVWIVDLENALVRFFRQPSGEVYTDITATETPDRRQSAHCRVCQSICAARWRNAAAAALCAAFIHRCNSPTPSGMRGIVGRQRPSV